MPDTSHTDLTLARQVSGGSERALEMLYQRHASLLYAFIYHHMEGCPKADIEDIWQETLLSALRSLGSYRGQSSLFTWMCAIARHKIADHLRRRGRLTQIMSETSLDDLSERINSGPLPAEVAERRETRLNVIAALDRLPGDYRQALLGRYADNLSVEEVARRMGRSYKTVESLLTRAREALRAAISSIEHQADHQFENLDKSE